LRQIGLSERHVSARRTLRWIKATGKTEVSIKDIRRDALAGSLDADQTQDLLEALTRSGWLRAKVLSPVQRGASPFDAGRSILSYGLQKLQKLHKH
jgi:hypothetical protein